MDKMLDALKSETHSFLVVGSLDAEELRKSLEMNVVDFRVMNEEVIKIEQIRELIHWLFLRPMAGSRKIVVIEKVENMLTQAANALLKTLEEPPSYVQIILTTNNKQKILPTIISRCRQIRLPFELNQDMPEIYLSPEEMGKLTIKDRFDWVTKVVDLTVAEIKDILVFWQVDLRKKMLAGQDKLEILTQINRAKDLLETNISVKLLLENIVIKM